MTKDEIIEMVREAGGYSPKKYPEEWRLDVDDLSRFAKLVAEKEREECAKICDEMGNTEANMNKTWRNGCNDSAKEIRARGQE